MDLSHSLARLISKVGHRAAIDAADQQALLDLPFKTRTLEAAQFLVREGATTEVSSLIVSGFAFRNKLTADGDRQIVSVHIPGDFVDLEGSMLTIADYNVQALTRLEVATIETGRLVELIDARPPLGRALWIDTLIDASIYREWVVNVGRRPAIQRIGHLMCEIGRRLEMVGLGTTQGYQFPMTQEQLADAVGLTPVHVNRTLKQMDAAGLITRHKRFIEIPDWERLRTASGFNELYLHLDQAA